MNTERVCAGIHTKHTAQDHSTVRRRLHHGLRLSGREGNRLLPAAFAGKTVLPRTSGVGRGGPSGTNAGLRALSQIKGFVQSPVSYAVTQTEDPSRP